VGSDEIISTTIDEKEENEMKEENNQEDEFFNEGFGFISVINLHLLAEKDFVKQIKKYFLGKVSDETKRKELQSLFDDTSKSLGLIINERMINVPPEIAPPMHKTLYEEIQLAHEDEEDKENSPWKFDNYLLVTSIYNEGKETQTKSNK